MGKKLPLRPARRFTPMKPRVKGTKPVIAQIEWYDIGDTSRIRPKRWVLVTDGLCIGFASFSNGVWSMSNNNQFYDLCPSLDSYLGQREPMYMSEITHFAYLPDTPKKKRATVEDRPPD